MNKLLSIILILTILGAVAVAPVVADEHAVGADLHIVQESYVASDVEVTDSETGLPIYEIEGGQVVIHTQNFDSDGVESWGVVEDDASMTYDQDLDAYVFNADNDATYTVYWVTEEETTEEVEVTNDEGETVTEEREVTNEVRYEAAIRAENTNMLVKEEQEINELEEKAGLLDDTLFALDNHGYIDYNGDLDGVDAEGILSTAVDRYHLIASPWAALAGNTFGIVILLFTFTGIPLLILATGTHVVIVEGLRKRLKRFEAVEAEEGGVEEKVQEYEEMRKRNNAATVYVDDVTPDDGIARYVSERFGSTILDSEVGQLEYLGPYTLIRDRLNVMHHAGYASVTEEDDGEIVDAKLVEEPEEYDDTTSIEQAGEELIDALGDDPLLLEFDPVDADVEWSEIETRVVSMNLDETAAMMEIDEGPVDVDEWGEFLDDFWRTVRSHPHTKPNGEIDDVRYVLSNLLQKSKIASDKYDHPVSQYWCEAIQTAMERYDPAEDAREQLDDRRTGK